MNGRNYVIFMLFVLALAGCSAKKTATDMTGNVPELTPIKIGSGVTMQTDDEVTWRKYTFKDVPLTFMFTDSAASFITYGDTYKAAVADIFITPQMALKNAKAIKGNHIWNLEQFNTDQVQSIMVNAYHVAFGSRSYIYCSFHKHHLSTLPFEDEISYLIDITSPAVIKAVAFPDVIVVDDMPLDFFPQKGHLCIRFDYYSRIKWHDSKVSEAVLTQDEKGNWVVE
ncbi:MAG: hypothetical protein EOP54_26275 [Sphingobacteriales bacterium]|nr:MAG: hypothetical protein EOP54_26275 [Sphingobacteriales bacterium]